MYIEYVTFRRFVLPSSSGDGIILTVFTVNILVISDKGNSKLVHVRPLFCKNITFGFINMLAGNTCNFLY
jgi:hypothetical protein